jgi:ATP-dependent RNA helicase DeaD
VESIGESGLDDRLVEAARAAGYDELTPLQSAALPVLRRGGNVVLHASTGAGVLAAFGMPLLDRLVAADAGGVAGGPRALVLAPTAVLAERMAARLAGLAGASGLAVRAMSPGWNVAGADVLVAATQDALAAVQTSALKLDAVETLVLTDLAEQFTLEAGDELGTIVGLVPRDSQRVVTSAELTGDVERFVESHARRALTVPARAADPASTPTQAPTAQIGYLVVPEAEKPAMLARLLAGVEGDVQVYVRTAARAEHVQGELGRRGIAAAGGGTIRVTSFAGGAEGAERVLSYDVPFSADELRRLHATGGTVLVTPAELPHFQRIAREAAFTTKQRRARALERGDVDAYRELVRTAVDSEDLSAQLLLLDPLFEEHSPAEVAAALSALVRRRAPAPAAAGPGVAGPAPKEATSSAFTRLFISIGTRDNARPADLVGAITGEAGIKGDQVGRIDIRESFSVVEVAADVAERVIRALNGTTMRGRSLRVDFDRKGSGGDAGSRAGGPRRRGAGGPPPRRPPR